MQIPGGYIQFPHIIYKALPEMAPAEALCTLVLIRETFGWHRATAFLRIKDFHNKIPIRSKTTVREALHASETEQDSATSETHGSLSDPNPDGKKSKSDPNSAPKRPIDDPYSSPKRSDSGPFLYNKETPKGVKREGEKDTTPPSMSSMKNSIGIFNEQL